MKTHQGISGIRKKSGIGKQKPNLWFYQEEIKPDESPGNEPQFGRNDHASILNDDYTGYSRGNSKLSDTKKQCAFVVEWQMNDNI